MQVLFVSSQLCVCEETTREVSLEDEVFELATTSLGVLLNDLGKVGIVEEYKIVATESD